MKKTLYIVLGLITFCLGVIGVILPILPTTPFLLVASFCFVRGSDRINNWFVGTKIYKNHLEAFLRDKCMTKKQKISILLFATVLLITPCIFVDNLMMRVTIGIVLVCKWYYFIFRIPNRKDNL
ncbi:MAG: YbaN family protein [Cellulosilyticaceae bacterium]